MNERSIIEAPEPNGGSLWVDQYLPGPLAEQGPKGQQFDVAWIRGALFRQRWLIAVVMVLAVMSGIAITLLTPPTYSATATVRVSPWGNSIVEGQEVAASIFSASEIDSFMQTQIAIVQSRNLAEQVARELDLGKRTALLGAEIDQARPANRTDAQWEEDKVKLAAGILQSSVSAAVPDQTQIIAINAMSEDRTLAAEIANAYSAAFVQSDVRRSLDSNAYARDYLLKQIEDVRGRLNEAELAANAYARNTGIVTQQTMGSAEDGSSTIVGANLASVNQTFAAVRANRIAAEQKWRAVANLPASQIPEVLGSPVVQGLTEERAKLNADLAVLRQRYNDDFPAIADIRSRLSFIDQQIERTGADVKASIRSQFQIARQQEEAMQRELGSVTSDALVEQDKKIEFTGLEREAEALREQLKSLLDRYNQINTASNLQSSTITPLDTATVPRSPVSPSLSGNLIIAVVLGLALAGGLALVREIFVDQFRRGEDIEDRLGLTFLGLTPFVKNEDLENEEANQFSTLMEAYASIRATIDYTVPRNGAVIQFTSSQASEGKSTTSLILAQLFARLGRKTLLIDSDLRKPSVHALLDIERPSAGLAEVLLGHVSFDAAKIETIRENLTVLSVAGIPPNPAELVSSAAFRELIDECRKEYSLVILDSSPMLGLADSAEIAKVVDATVFVIEANRTSLAQARTAVGRLHAVGANVLGGVLTKYRALEAGSDYTYQYQYYQYGKK
ncbi:GumC family protein [Erythrobacter donghaensis]|uniref:GumC family protein n=1 Tax=Erythrobacter donghaensis TaxID=267135 RepID=UPI000A35F614|nr:polysaccharide biosynthesis tyrosine autokinase [Erythrobacter donghaensis]